VFLTILITAVVIPFTAFHLLVQELEKTGSR
jgi:hypothetical protein